MKRNQFLKSSAALIAGAGVLSSFKDSSNEQDPLSKKIPKALIKDDLIAITAPAGAIWNKSHIDKIEDILTKEGFKTVIGKTNYDQDGFLAASDEERAEEFMQYINDKTVKGIVTMRGGWGCQRLLDLLDYNAIRNNPKVIVGFSDITSLINAIYLHAGVVTFHGPCGYSSWGDVTMNYVKLAMIIGKPFTMSIPTIYKADFKTWVSGKAKGELVGGNLTVLSALVGTPHEPNWANKLLFLEEIGEEPYRVDRMLWQLKQAGAFEQINGLIIGSFKNCNPEEPHKSFSLAQVFEQHFAKQTFPIYQGAAIGHIGPKFTVPIGVNAEIDADKMTLTTLESSVI